MHELSVCLALMSQVNRIAGEHGAVRVDRIVLNIGPLSGIEPALLRKAFPSPPSAPSRKTRIW
jgi:hydrogenase nickel incorporation protein HypA/HybF